MKTLTIILIMFYSSFSYSQELHLSYNIFNEENEKVINNKEITFFIGENYFKHKKNKHCYKVLDNSEISNKIITEKRFNEKIQSLKSNQHKNGMIIIKKKSDIFKKIFLYERKDNCIYVYCVDWIDAIVN